MSMSDESDTIKVVGFSPTASPPCSGRSVERQKSMLSYVLTLPPGVESSKLCRPQAFQQYMDDADYSDDDCFEDDGLEDEDMMDYTDSEESESFCCWDLPISASQPIPIPTNRRHPSYKHRIAQAERARQAYERQRA